MKGVNIVPSVHRVNGKLDSPLSTVPTPGVGRKTRSIFVRSSISRGRGYAVVLIREEIDESEIVHVRAAPRTATLARKGHFHVMPAASSFASLPASALLRILSYMDDAKTVLACSSVCKEWRRIISSTYTMRVGPQMKKPLDQHKWPRMKNLFSTTKLKIFCGADRGAGNNGSTSGFFETSGQRKDSDSFREVSVKMADAGERNSRLLSYLAHLAPFLTPMKAFLLADIEIDDSLLTFLLAWQPRTTEMRLLRCSFAGVSSIGIKTILCNSRLKHLYIDNCRISATCPMANASSLTDVCKVLTHVELCFHDQDAIMSEIIEDNFLISIAQSWTKKSDIRWIKLSNAPKVTTDGVEAVLQAFFKLRRSSKSYYSDNNMKDFIKTPNLVFWLRDTSFDPDDFLKRRLGKRWFRDDKLPTSSRRKLRDNYGGEDVVMWLETTGTVLHST